MADPPHPNTGQDTGAGRDRGATGTSRWQKAVGIIGLVVVIVAIAVVLFRVSVGGGHDPGAGTQGGNQQQTGGGAGGEHTPPPWVPEGHR
jgi:hypothetical protein